MLMICISEQRLFSLYPIPDIYPTISGRKTGFEPTEPTTEQHGKKEDFYIPILFADTSGNDHRMERYQKSSPVREEKRSLSISEQLRNRPSAGYVADSREGYRRCDGRIHGR